MSFFTHLECSLTGERIEKGAPVGLSPAGRPLLARYDLEAASQKISPDLLKHRRDGEFPGFWRYEEILPVRDRAHRISLGEVMTPLISLAKLSDKAGFNGEIIVKDESRLPTGSFKARGLALAVSMASELGIDHVAMPSNGNAGAAMAAYAAAAGMKSSVLCPDDTPEVNIREIGLRGSDVYRVNGLINDCGKIVNQGKETVGWFDLSTLKEPFRIEGKKTMGLELAEQLNWQLPDAIFYPTGGGTGLIGMWKAFNEMEAMGWIDHRRPKMIAVQAAGCAPIVKAWRAGSDYAEPWENAETAAAGIRVPVAIGDFLILRALRESGGFAEAVPEKEIFKAREKIAREEGLVLCPEGAATYAAFEAALARGDIGANERVILFNCATGLKYPLPSAGRLLDRNRPVEFTQFSQ